MKLISILICWSLIFFKSSSAQIEKTNSRSEIINRHMLYNSNYPVVPSQKVILADSSLADSIKIAEDSVQIAPEINILESDTSKFSRSGWILHKPDIQNVIYKDLADVLIYLPGLYSKNLNLPGQLSLTAMHGRPSNDLTILLDGRPIKNPYTNLMDLNIIPAEYVEQITVTTNNTINITTQRYSSDLPYSKVYFHKGPSAFSDVDIIFGQQIARAMDALLGFTLKGFSGPLEPDSYEHHIGRIKLHYQHSPGWRLFYSLLYNRIKLHPIGPKLSTNQYATPDARSKQLRYDHTLTLKGNILKSYYQNLLIQVYYSSIFKELHDVSYHIFTANRYRYAGLTSQLDHQIRKHYLQFKAHAEHDWINTEDEGRKKQTLGAINFKDDWFLYKDFGVRGIIDLSGITNQGVNFDGGLGLLLQINNFLKTTASLKQTTRYPTLFELYSLRGNAELKPERIQQADLQLQFGSDSSFKINTNFYFQHIRRIIDYEMKMDTTLSNRGERNYYGLDLQCQWFFWNRFIVGSNITLVNVENSIIYEAPSAMIYSYIQYKNSFFQNDLKVNLRVEGRYWSDRWSNTSLPYAFYPSYIKLPRVWIINAIVFFKYGDVNFFISFENILNREYQLVYGYPMNGRTFHYGLRWQFWE